jgi:outer membrane protein assembly factor BamB
VVWLLLFAVAAWGQGTFHGNLARNGVYAGAGPKTLGGVKWMFKTGGPIIASPTVSEGVVYIASLDGYMHALDAESGKEKWNFKSSMPIASTPAVANGTLYFVSSRGALAALDIVTGKPKWVCPTEYERKFEAKNLHGYPSPAQTIPDAWDVYISSPAVDGNKVIFGSGDSSVYAVDATNGQVLWKFATGDIVHASPAVANGVVYIGSWDSRFYAIDEETGLEKWHFQAGEDPIVHNQVGFQSSAAVDGGVVYVGCRDGHVYALDAATGKKRWDYPTAKSWVNGTPAVRDGVVYVGTSDSARFMALDARNGRLRWNFDAKAYMFSSAALADDLAYVGDHNGRLYAVDIKTGKLAWEFVTDAAKSDPLKILTPEGRLSEGAFAPLFHDFEDMYLDMAKFASVGAVMGSPVVDKGVVYFGSMDGNVYALR